MGKNAYTVDDGRKILRILDIRLGGEVMYSKPPKWTELGVFIKEWPKVYAAEHADLLATVRKLVTEVLPNKSAGSPNLLNTDAVGSYDELRKGFKGGGEAKWHKHCITKEFDARVRISGLAENLKRGTPLSQIREHKFAMQLKFNIVELLGKKKAIQKPPKPFGRGEGRGNSRGRGNPPRRW